MKTQTPSEKSHWRRAGLLVLAAGGLLVLSSCHHGVYGQPKRPHPHIATFHRHAPDAYAPMYYGRGKGKAPVASKRPRQNYWAHHHTTRDRLFREPNIRHRLGF